ncbi:SpdA protein [Streptomyces violaceusniger]|uniref:DUF2637 domain-containing protein n=2 Tax=Streptomyces violaceusniger group TaxID=2839105 RepID=A0ABD5JGL6_9ACTN|nr:DUF2637 domain-containing protein [Streptomyces violaceusniger]KUL48959.1 SpdA protein [Streptomyces violaceusniger]MEE4586788.1 DUF2637 domain-containing protein [Streptomyces sp. DSM 41602]
MRAYLARVDAVLVQAVIAAALSFAHLHDLASAAGQNGWKAWAYPVSVDLLLVAAWRRLRSGASKAAGWCWFVVALAASLGANVATAGLLDLTDVPAWLRILVAGWPAVAFLGGTLLAHTAPAPETASASAEPTEAVPVPAAPKTAGPTTTPEPEPQQSSPHVPAALVNHARKLADDHHARTGSPIDPETLRARLGVPAPLADAIASRL